MDISALNLYDGLPAKYKGNKPNTGPEPPPPDFSRFLKPKPGATPEELAELEKRRADMMKRRGPEAAEITDIAFRVNFVEIIGPFNPEEGPRMRAGKRSSLVRRTMPACTRKIVADFARRAYRGPVAPQEVNRC